MAKLTMCSEALASRPSILVTLHHSSLAPSDEDWDTYIRQCQVALDAARAANAPVANNLVFTDKPGPNAAQRKKIADTVAAKTTDSAVVSSSSMVRGIVTALSWLGVPIRSFAPKEWRTAFARVGFASGAEIDEVRKIVGALAERMGEEAESIKPFLAGSE